MNNILKTIFKFSTKNLKNKSKKQNNNIELLDDKEFHLTEENFRKISQTEVDLHKIIDNIRKEYPTEEPSIYILTIVNKFVKK
jgi:hypothetical protein